MRRWGLLLAVPLALAGCGGGSYSVARTAACLKDKGAKINFPSTALGSTAKGGGIEVWIGAYNLNIGFGRTTGEAKRLLRLYGSVGNPGHVRIYRRRNAVVAWDVPAPAVRTTVDGCLR